MLKPSSRSSDPGKCIRATAKQFRTLIKEGLSKGCTPEGGMKALSCWMGPTNQAWSSLKVLRDVSFTAVSPKRRLTALWGLSATALFL